jgi:hypothetical protein
MDCRTRQLSILRISNDEDGLSSILQMLQLSTGDKLATRLGLGADHCQVKAIVTCRRMRLTLVSTGMSDNAWHLPNEDMISVHRYEDAVLEIACSSLPKLSQGRRRNSRKKRGGPSARKNASRLVLADPRMELLCPPNRTSVVWVVPGLSQRT